MTKMAVQKTSLGSKGLKVNMGKPKLRSWVDISIDISILVQYAGTVLVRTQSSVVDVRFGFTKNVLIFQVD